jgi:hypothetical protein
LTSVPAPWLAATWHIPDWLIFTLRGLTVAIVASLGLLIVLLVRPKNRMADIAAGSITGLCLAAVIFTVSLGWIIVIITAVLPARSDLGLLSETAWIEPASQTEMPESVVQAHRDAVKRALEKYPDLEQVPPEKRGVLLYSKVLTDVTTGIPSGLCYSMLCCLGAGVLLCVGETMAASLLLRRQGRVRAMLVPYLEVTFPGTTLFLFCFNLLFGLYAGAFVVGLPHLLLFGLLVLAIAGPLRGWPWLLRLLLQAGWVWAMGTGSFYQVPPL